MRPKKLISTLLAVLALAAYGASYAAGPASPAPGAKKLLKRRISAPSPVFIVRYEPAGEHAPNLHFALEGSLPSIESFLASAGQPSGNRPQVPTLGAKGPQTPAQVDPVALGPTP